MIAFATIIGIIGACGLFLLGALYLSRVPFWNRLAKQNPINGPTPTAYSFQDVAVTIYDDSTSYGIKARIRLTVEAGSLFVALQPIGFGWQDQLPPLQLPLGDLSSEASTLRRGNLRIALSWGGTVLQWKEILPAETARTANVETTAGF